MSTNSAKVSFGMQSCAIHFISAMKQISSNGPRKYVYAYKNIDPVSCTPDKVPNGYTKMSICHMCALTLLFSNDIYAKHEIEQLKTGLL